MKNDLKAVEAGIRKYWDMEFGETPFPEKMFNTFLMLSHAFYTDGMSPSAMAHLLHSYVSHLKESRKR
jgi:hypothetical protein